MAGDRLLLAVIREVVMAIMQMDRNRHWIARNFLARLNLVSRVGRKLPAESEQLVTRNSARSLTAELESEAELKRLHGLIEERKRIARDTDISYHLWNLYQSLFRCSSAQSSDPPMQDGKWYDVKILQANTQNGLSTFEFELQGSKYKFVDDEEKQSWRDKVKFFSLFLYDALDRCLIEIPMKVRVDSTGRDYSLLLHGPEAFLPGGWISDFINVRLKQQSIRNHDIREQQHQERLREIEDLKNRFGLSD